MRNTMLILFVLATSCCLEVGRSFGDLTIMSWNVQNLFDGEDDGREYSDFSIADGSWSEELYLIRLKSIAKIIKLNNPDIIGLQEIEGLSVLEDLSERLDGYDYMAVSRESGAINTGFLSRYPISKVGFIKPSSSNLGVRSMLEVHVQIDDTPLVLINNHWKSKRGTFTENLRILSGAALKKRLAELNAYEVVLLGDFNENYDEYTRIGRSYDTALMYRADGEGLRITDAKRPESHELYTPWPDSEDEGSYSYRDQWESIDHFLLNRRLMDDDDFYFKSFHVDRRELLFNSSGGIYKWVTDYGTGYADHLPIILKLDRDTVTTTLE